MEQWNLLFVSCTVSLLAPGPTLAADLARNALEHRIGLTGQPAASPWQPRAPAEVLHRRCSTASASFCLVCSSATRVQSLCLMGTKDPGERKLFFTPRHELKAQWGYWGRV